jgi:adenine/guanine/hypoxanthine permease
VAWYLRGRVRLLNLLPVPRGNFNQAPFYSVFTVFLMLYRVKGAILIGIFLTSIISWPRPTSVTVFPHDDAGDMAFDFFKQVVTFRPLKLVGNAIDYNYG